MTNKILENIRAALRTGPIATAEKRAVNLAGAWLVGDDLGRERLSALFCERAESSAASAHRLDRADRLGDCLRDIIAGRSRIAVCELNKINARLGGNLIELLGDKEIVLAESVDESELYRCEVGITPVEFAVAETGSVAVSTGAHRARLTSLVPEVHVALLWRDQLVPDLMDLKALLPKIYPSGLPTAVTLITGPSKTADIEMNLVIGVHGPAQLHLIVLP